MPNQTKPRRTARQIRRSADAGKNKKRQRRQAGNRSSEAASRIIANSIFTVTLKPKPGIEVLNKMDGKKKRSYHDDTDDYYKMYADLLQCFQNALPLVKEEQSTFDPLASGLAIGASLKYVSDAFKNNIVPEGFEFNVDRNDDGYFFTIYDECYFAGYWHAFEIKPIIYHLRNRSPKLHDLFIEFIKCFMDKAGIMAWWNGGMGYAEYMLEEEINDWDNYHGVDPEEDDKATAEAYESALKTFNNYSTGEAKYYQELITITKYRTPQSILKSLSRFDKRNKTVQWMKEVCEFLLLPGRVNDFTYPEMEEEQEMGLSFDQQVAIIWDWKDEYTHQQEQSIDAEASGIGVCSPMINIGIMPFSKSIDLNGLKERCQWPKGLTKILDSQRDLINGFVKKKK